MSRNVYIKLSGPIADSDFGARLFNHFYREMEKELRFVIEPKLRAIIPERSGRLRASLRTVRTTRTLGLTFGREGFYWRFVHEGRLRDQSNRLVNTLLLPSVRAAFRRAWQLAS